ncbi:DUF262 domain-containing protein [Promicromonospora sp. NPDC090134]|uniref:DUF262 domain-containing protein n=1 Tax=Promicromonospora sp. NPDC090134 TaxID=3364408 RepID=UPI003802D442
MGVTSDLQQYSVADFMEWHSKRQLELNPDFQRGNVWPLAARTFLIDSILRHLPIPKIYLRTRVDLETKRSYREVVDGQQRLRAILDFGNDGFALGPRANEYKGKRYSDLTPEEQERFLGYSISVDQLINASDADVLEVFSRLNSYTVPVNPPELRHAEFQGEFKWAVHEMSRQWATLWEDYRVVGRRDAVRLLSDSLMAEMFGIVLEGVRDGGQPKIDALYRRQDKAYERGVAEGNVDATLTYILRNFAELLRETSLSSAPHFLMLFAAAEHVLHGIPIGELDELPERGEVGDPATVAVRLEELAALIAADELPEEPSRAEATFWNASKSTTQRIASRKARFPVYVKAIQGKPFDW